jgi:polysaccharide biosynthesis protein PslH
VKILWVKANKILPLSSGGDIRSYHIARQLAAHHQLTFLSYYGGPRDSQYEQDLKAHFPGAECICTGGTTGGMGRGLDYLLRLGKRAPYAVSRFESAQVREMLRAWFQEKEFDVAVCDFLDAAINFPAKLTVPTVLFQHNVESEIWRRHAETSGDVARRALYRMEFAKMLRYEQEMVRKFEQVIAVSEHDRGMMSAWVDAKRITVVPTGVNLSQFRGNGQARAVGPLVTFVGAMDWEPNIDAVEYFCREIWPAIKARVPAARFRIVGRNPDSRTRSLACEAVEVTGSVVSVVDHLRESAVVVVPLRIGGGTRIKIYEAMAAGKAVVSTSVGAEGLDVHDGEDIILADAPTGFADAVSQLLDDVELRARYERAAAALASRYDWSAIGQRFAAVLERVAGNSAQHALVAAGQSAEAGEARLRS